MSPMRFLAVIPALALSLAVAAGASDARAQDSERQTIYWPLVTDGSSYRRVPYPREAGPLVVMAQSDIVLDVREAEVAYWPITREYLTDVRGASPAVEGTFEIVDGDGNVVEIAEEPFLLWYPDGVGAGPGRMVRGEAASELYSAYVRDAKAAAEALRDYQRIVADHHTAVEAWIKLAAQRPDDLPDPPPELAISEPEPYRAYASEPEPAAIVTLEPGEYTVRLRGPDGEVVPSTERRLVAFAALADGVGYVVRPGDRWTQPAISYNPDELIYTTGRADLYFQPVPVSEFRASEFTRLFRPQSIEAADPFQTVWVPQANKTIDEGETVSLALSRNSETVGEEPARAYRVAQTSGRSRGYTIEPFEAAPGSPLEPDFSAIRIARDQEITALSLTGDEVFAASARTVRIVPAVNDAWLFLAAALPLLVGLAVRLVRRRKTSRRTSGSSSGPGRKGHNDTLHPVLGAGAGGAVTNPGRP